MLIQALVVDDSRSALDYLKRTIEADGQVQVIAFTEPVLALASARNLDIDIVFADYEMPNMDGISLIRRLRSLPKFSDIPIVMITSVESDEVRLRALDAGATDFLPKQPKSLETQVRLRNMIRLGLAVRKLNDRAALLASEVARATHELQEREEEIILRLALSVEYRDNDTGDHTLRVAKYSRMIAEGLGLPDRLCRDIYLAAPLHDVGKVATPDDILLKPGRLTPDEIAMMQTHTTVGGSILAGSRCELIQLAADIAIAHHERWDGTGYPNRLKGEAIPVAARIVAVADVFDALATKRPYKEAMPLPVARKHLEDGRGQHFDPACVDAFLARWDQVVAIATDRILGSRQDAAPLQPQLQSEAARSAVTAPSA
ncbi:HD-GYP domain-containing protein [Rhodopseudomonas palustris]|uniref:Response regulator receiver modulated metal dependent phosphohydrolase n=1 Tax=Rhodopseudomonas palustris (strain DX-1) TaxID=652103 RepID=E6VKN0_RHOPX|nr:HD domain-containing phosphohydrolase [Rhodopseudomonas palustris]